MLYEQPSLLRIAMWTALFPSEQWKLITNNANRSKIILRETFTLVEDSREWEGCFDADIAASFGDSISSKLDNPCFAKKSRVCHPWQTRPTRAPDPDDFVELCRLQRREFESL